MKNGFLLFLASLYLCLSCGADDQATSDQSASNSAKEDGSALEFIAHGEQEDYLTEAEKAELDALELPPEDLRFAEGDPNDDEFALLLGFGGAFGWVKSAFSAVSHFSRQAWKVASTSIGAVLSATGLDRFTGPISAFYKKWGGKLGKTALKAGRATVSSLEHPAKVAGAMKNAAKLVADPKELAKHAIDLGEKAGATAVAVAESGVEMVMQMVGGCKPAVGLVIGGLMGESLEGAVEGEIRGTLVDAALDASFKNIETAKEAHDWARNLVVKSPFEEPISVLAQTLGTATERVRFIDSGKIPGKRCWKELLRAGGVTGILDSLDLPRSDEIGEQGASSSISSASEAEESLGGSILSTMATEVASDVICSIIEHSHNPCDLGSGKLADETNVEDLTPSELSAVTSSLHKARRLKLDSHVISNKDLNAQAVHIPGASKACTQDIRKRAAVWQGQGYLVEDYKEDKKHKRGYRQYSVCESWQLAIRDSLLAHQARKHNHPACPRPVYPGKNYDSNSDAYIEPFDLPPYSHFLKSNLGCGGLIVSFKTADVSHAGTNTIYA